MDCLQGVVVAKVVPKLYIERNNKNIIINVGRFCEVPSMYYFFKDLCSDVMFLYSCHHQIHNYIEDNHFCNICLVMDTLDINKDISK